MGIGLVGCNNQRELSNESSNNARSLLPAQYYGDASYYEHMYCDIYDVIEMEQNRHEVATLLSILPDGWEELLDTDDIINYIGEDALVQTDLWNDMDDVISNYFGFGIEYLYSTSSGGLDTLLSVIRASGFIDDYMRAYLFSHLDLTEYDIVILCIECALHNYMHLDMNSCILVVKDIHNYALQIPIQLSLYPELTEIQPYTVIEMEIESLSDLENIDFHTYFSLNTIDTLCFFSQMEMLDYEPEGYEYVTAIECDEAYATAIDNAHSEFNAEKDRIAASSDSDLVKNEKRALAYLRLCHAIYIAGQEHHFCRLRALIQSA